MEYKLLKIAKNKKGTFAIQAFINTVKNCNAIIDKLIIIVHENLIEMLQHINSSFVLKKLTEVVQPEELIKIHNIMLKNPAIYTELIKSKYAVVVLKNIMTKLKRTGYSDYLT
jgi:hypothetical protein